MNFEQILLSGFVVINVMALLFMAFDKRRSMGKREEARVPEGLIFCIGCMFGALGVYAGMFILRHKIRKWYFQVGIPLLIVQNIATLYLLKEYLHTLT